VPVTITKHGSKYGATPLSNDPKTSEVTTRLCTDQFAEALNNLHVSDSNQELTVKQLFIKLSYLTAVLSCLTALLITILE
jgi:hypothetical protein